MSFNGVTYYVARCRVVGMWGFTDEELICVSIHKAVLNHVYIVNLYHKTHHANCLCELQIHVDTLIRKSS